MKDGKTVWVSGLLLVLVTAAVAGLGVEPRAANGAALSPTPVPVELTLPVGAPTVAAGEPAHRQQQPTKESGSTAAQVTYPPPSSTPAHTSPVSPVATVVSRPWLEGSIGQSVQGRAILAYRFGNGPIKVVLVGNVHGDFEANTLVLVQQMADHFRSHPEEVPPNVSLWLVPTLNPDGLATGHRWNANEVDLNRNADTNLDGCAGNDWSADTVGHEGPHPGAGGSYPFSEPETRAIRDFLLDASVAIFYHSAAGSIFADTCERHAPSRRLAQVLAASTMYQLPEEGWVGYPVTGDLGDYFSGEGVATVTVELTNHDDAELARNLAGVEAVLGAVGEIVSTEALAVAARFVSLDSSNITALSLPTGSLLHPIAMELMGDVLYLLDSGRVLSLDLSTMAAPLPADDPRTTMSQAAGDALHVVLEPGALVAVESTSGAAVQVLEPLDLAVDGGSLFVLDRAADVYRYDAARTTWSVERQDRRVRDTSDHYFVALSVNGEANDSAEPQAFLLETTHEQVWQFSPGRNGVASGEPKGRLGASWAPVPQGRDVDLSAAGDAVYVLTRSLNAPMGDLWLYRQGRQDSSFRSNITIMHPRQVVATVTSVFVLDRAGHRLLAHDPETGALQTLYQFFDRRDVSAIWADPSGDRLILAGRDKLYFYGRRWTASEASAPGVTEASTAGLHDADESASGTGVDSHVPRPNDLQFLEGLRGLLMPLDGATITRRDFQMPGAPRHYRLGVHEGMDFYGHTVGVPVNRQTTVRAVADGVVIRALTDYQPLSAETAAAWAVQVQSLGFTPPEVLDGYRGMQVWIDHGAGLVSRMAHLGSILPGVVEGAVVKRGQPLATVGNSGTPDSVRSTTSDVHLHLELWVGDGPSGADHYVGQFLRPIETREWLERILQQ